MVSVNFGGNPIFKTLKILGGVQCGRPQSAHSHAHREATQLWEERDIFSQKMPGGLMNDGLKFIWMNLIMTSL
jgi:hypothetical protein